MTTIAYKNGLMCSDSLLTCQAQIRRGFGNKIFVGIGGTLFGFAGRPGLEKAFIPWFEKGMNRAEQPFQFDDEELFGALVVLRSGQVLMFNQTLIPCETTDTCHAIGTGNEIAIGAMEHGANAYEAVEVAIRRDPFSGGHIQQLSLPKRKDNGHQLPKTSRSRQKTDERREAGRN